MEIRRVSVAQLNPAAYNPRKDLQPNDPEYKKLARSIDKFGYVEPIIWNERSGNVVGGHQRLKILIESGAKEIDVSVVNLSDEDEKALNIALNKIDGAWDEEKLSSILQELSQSLDTDVSVTGFDQDEIDSLLASFAEETAGYNLPGMSPYVSDFFERGSQAKQTKEKENEPRSQSEPPAQDPVNEDGPTVWVVTIFDLSTSDIETVTEFLSGHDLRYKTEQVGGSRVV